jgi:multiple sugar transport system substrate-binding protein
MKRFGVILLVLVMLMIPISAVAKITITWWINPWRIAPPGFPADKAPTEEDFPKWAAEEFMRQNPGVEIKYVVVGNSEYSQKMAAAIATGTQPDIFKGPVWDNRWVGAGLLEPIDDYLTQEEIDDFYEIALESGFVDGKHYIWPWNLGTNGMGTTMLLYTPDFERVGVDWQKIVNEGWTMEEFVEIAKKLTWDSNGDGTIDHYAISFGAKDTHNILNFLYAFGGELTNEDETIVTFNTPQAVAGLQFVIDLVEKHKVAPKGVEAMGIYDVIGNFHAHRTSIGFGGPYEIGRITRYVKSGQLAEEFYPVIAPFPHIEGQNGASYTSASGFVVFRQKDAEKRDMVMKFAKFLTNKENTALLESLIYLTARKSVNELLFQNDEYLNEQAQTFARVMDETGRDFFGSQSFPWAQIDKFFVSALEGAFSLTQTPQLALDGFVLEANRVLQRIR